MSLFGLDKVSNHPEGLELLTTVYDNVQLAVVESLLRGAEIPYLKRERGSGSSVKIIAGFSMFGTDVFVRREQLDDARDLLDATVADDTANDAQTDTEPEDKTDK